MGQASNTSKMGISIEESIKTAGSMGSELTNGRMTKQFMRAISRMVSDMERVNGQKERPSIVADIVKGSSKVMESYTFPTAIFTKVTSSRIRDRAMEKCSGLIAVSIKENGEVASRTEKDRCI